MSDLSIIEIDPELLGEFIDEATEGLAAIPDLLVRLERQPSDMEIVQEIFRPVHSLKGNAAFFDLAKIALLSHELETLLDLVRKGVLRIESTLVGTLLAGVDLLAEMLGRVRCGESELANDEQESLFIKLLESVKETYLAAKSGDAKVWESIFEDLTAIRKNLPDGSKELKKRLDSVIFNLEPLRPEKQKKQTEKVSPWKTFGKPAGRILEILFEPLGDVLEEKTSKEVLMLLQEMLDIAGESPARAIIADALETCCVFAGAGGFDSLCREVVLDKLKELGIEDRRTEKSMDEGTHGTSRDSGMGKNNAGPSAAEADSLSKTPIKKTMRVAENHIDTFLAYVGEFLVVRDMFANLGRKIIAHVSDRNILAEFRRANETFSSLSNDLQKSIMDVRKVSVKPLLQKVTRIVRDVAKNSGKEITVELRGEEVEVDKSLVDLLDAPLVHIVRNAADHGIEAPGEREESGKNPVGNIVVEISEDEESLVLTISDDGGGLDFAAIRAKAESMGLISGGEYSKEDEIADVIFISGLSTAEKITEVSGRGVGLDVVKRMVDEAGGTIAVKSLKGEGCSFRITLSKAVTTQIMSAYLIGIDGQPFMLPLDRIGETCEAIIGELKSVNENNRCFVRNNEVIPLLPLKETLGFNGSENSSDRIVIVTVNSADKRVGLIVDEVLGVQQVVLRQIDGLESSRWIQEGALLGDGSVALMLDVDRLVNRTEEFCHGT